MRDHPILFSTPMVRAILAGQKTQTRRVVDPKNGDLVCVRNAGPLFDPRFPHHQKLLLESCPYGQRGDRLWVRETWAPVDKFGGSEREEPVDIGYRADFSAISWETDNAHTLDTYAWNWPSVKWRPSIFMPRWACRLTLKVTDVRVERLQAITGEDAAAEGIRVPVCPVPGCPCETCGRTSAMCPATETAHVMAYASLWDSINGKRAPWASDPWVWVVSFRRSI